MQKGDKSLTPHIDYTDTKANIEATANPIEGMRAVSTDTHESGFYDGSAWVWGGGGGYTPPATTADNDFQVGSGGAWVKKTLAEVVTILRTSLDSIFSPIAKGVTNGDSHDHSGGDGAQIAYSGLSGLPTLGNSASRNVGTTYETVATGNDSRFSNITVGHCGSRLSLSATEPNPTTEIFNATTLYVHFADGYNYYPQYNDHILVNAFQPTIAVTRSVNVSGLLANTVYDVFLYSGILFVGMAWATATTRAASGGLVNSNGIMVNASTQTMTSSAGSENVASGKGTYIGTICTTATAGQLEWSKQVKSLWNKYNRLPARFSVTPGGTTLGNYVQWSIYSTTWIEALYSATWRIKYVLGEPSAVNAIHSSLVSHNNASDYISISIGFDTVTQPVRKAFSYTCLLTQLEVFENNHGLPVGMGSHYIAALYAQYSLAGGASLIYSSFGTAEHMHGASVPPAVSYLQVEVDL